MDVRYWTWLQMCLGEGAHFLPILEDFGSAEALYEKTIIDWKMSPSLSPTQVERLSRFSLKDAERVIMDCDRNGWDILCYADERYPQKLRNIPNPPAVLYLDGTLPEIDACATLGIVGTRKASGYGRKAARLLAKGCALCGAVIVSGGALGVDSEAHGGALDANAPTVAVLGSGFGTGYLKANSELRAAIRRNGALVTEFPPYFRATRNSFPLRNRIISGLSDGLLVVEAGVKSGSLITAGHAAEQGRDIFAVPASLLDYNFYGTNKLIEDGATVATSVRVLLERYASAYSTLDLSKCLTLRELAEGKVDEKQLKQLSFDAVRSERRERLEREEQSFHLVGDEQTVFQVLTEELQMLDTVIEKASLDAPKVLTALTLLEMKGLIESASGKRYRKK